MIEFIIEKTKKNWEFILIGFLWLCVWATYNTDIFRFFSPGFPHNFFDLIHGIRSFFPFLALTASISILIKGKKINYSLFKGPLGLILFYSIIGMIASIFSKSQVSALYWAILYSSVVIVLLAIINSSNPLKKLFLIININWVIAGIIAFSLFLFFIIQPGVISSLTYNFLICTQRPYEGLGHVAAEIQTFGMAGTRPTGLGRYAGVIGIVALANFLCIKNDKKLSKFFLFFIFIIFFLILVFAKGRTEIIGFIIAMVFVIWLAKKFNFYIILGTGLIILLVGFSIFYNIPCTNSIGIVNQLLPKNNMNNTPNSTLNITALNSTSPKNILNNLEPKNKLIFFTLSGRTTGIWPQSWRLFLSSPLIGYGFQADRVFLNGQHTHNTLFQALVQTGLLGTIPLIFAFLLTFIYLCYALKTKNIKEEEKCFLVVISGVFVFFAVRAITESSGAYFDADWLFLAPIIAYIQVYNDKKSDNYIENNLINLSGNKINIVKIPYVISLMSKWISEKQGKSRWIVVTGMHGLVQSNKNPEFKNMLNSADLFVPDGISLVILGKLHGFDIKKRVSGADLMSAFFMEAEKKGHSNFFYGDTDDTLKDLKTKLLQKFPNLNIAGMYSPPFRKLTKQEDKEMIKMINNTKPDVLWVGLGLPKQENWIFENKEKLDVSVLVGVGAAFKFLSGRVKRAPEWLGNLGFEWLWRLVFETKTVWRRIFLDGPFFFLIIIKDFFKFNLKKQMINIIRSTVKSLLMFIEKFCLFPIGIIMGNKLLEQLIPYDVEGFEEKIRLGNLSDGGYVIPSKILSLIEVEYCYGVADYIDFEEDLMKSFDVPIRFYDHTIKSLPIKNKNFFFKKQGIAAKKYGDFDTFYNHLRENNDVGKKILLKMDIESAEWKVLDEIIEESSENVVAIILEIHRLYRYEKIINYVKVLKNINSKFTLVHLHGNNYGDRFIYGNARLPSVLELTLINNNLVKEKSVMTRSLPSEKDYPNINGKEDVILNFWKK